MQTVHMYYYCPAKVDLSFILAHCVQLNIHLFAKMDKPCGDLVIALHIGIQTFHSGQKMKKKVQ